MEKKVKIKKKCGECKRIRPLAEFKSSNGQCEHCASKPQERKSSTKCLSCGNGFQPKNKFNKVCEICKQRPAWSTTFYSLEIY